MQENQTPHNCMLEVTHSSSILASRYNPNYAELSRRSDKILYTENLCRQTKHHAIALCMLAQVILALLPSQASLA